MFVKSPFFQWSHTYIQSNHRVRFVYTPKPRSDGLNPWFISLSPPASLPQSPVKAWNRMGCLAITWHEPFNWQSGLSVESTATGYARAAPHHRKSSGVQPVTPHSCLVRTLCWGSCHTAGSCCLSRVHGYGDPA